MTRAPTSSARRASCSIRAPCRPATVRLSRPSASTRFTVLPDPVLGGVDWLGQEGTLLGGGTTPPANWFYERVWQTTQLTPGVKQISVTATVKSSVGNSIIPKSTVVALKSSRF